MANLHDDLTPTPDLERPGRTTSDIGDSWGVVFAQGGVVMSAMLRAAETVLGRGELRLAASSAVFCRPVSCGRVACDVEVVRSGRSGAQVEVRLTAGPDPGGGPDVVATAVYVHDDAGAPAAPGPPCPDELLGPPPVGDGGHGGLDGDDHGVAFLRQTEWRPAGRRGPDAGRAVTWFRFQDPPVLADGTWDPTTLVVPGDSLGPALPPEVLTSGSVSSVSLQLSAQFLGPVRGTWLGIESMCQHLGGGTASGVSHLWDERGHLAATVGQTALLRSA